MIVGFGPTPSMHPAKSTFAIAQVRSQEKDAEVTQLKNQVAFLMEKVNRYENLEERVTIIDATNSKSAKSFFRS
ncbi:hypothetical protein SO802_009332 [Lithocarpus litseifolius]|uniref:Uncharacterized protein n=1 Tax=Lithocarpus litseifolius TaxID=425828 RepID=A0AAW2DB29_9ROSI